MSIYRHLIIFNGKPTRFIPQVFMIIGTKGDAVNLRYLREFLKPRCCSRKSRRQYLNSALCGLLKRVQIMDEQATASFFNQAFLPQHVPRPADSFRRQLQGFGNFLTCKRQGQ